MQNLRLTLVGVVLLGLCAAAPAAVIVDDRFDDGGLSDGADLLDAAWSKVAGDNSDVITVVNNELFLNNARNNNSGNYPLAKGSYSLGSETFDVGESLRLSFDLRITVTTPLSTAAGNTQSAGAAYRIGLGTSSNSFLASFGSGIAPSGSIVRYAADIASGTSLNLTTAGGGTIALNDNDTHSYLLVITRTAADSLSFTATVDDTTWSGTATGVSNFNFNRILVGQGSVNNLDTAFDNFKVELVPEPAMASVLALAGLLCLRRRVRA